MINMNTDNFLWTADLVAEFCEYAGMRIGKSQDIKQQVNLLMEDFKQSKTIPKKEKEYEILTMINNKLGVHDYSWQCDLSNDGCKIHSVKRLSDNCVFTIGDKVVWYNYHVYDWGSHFIKQIYVSKEGYLRVIGNDPQPFDFPFSEIKKIEDKKPILTTEDNCLFDTDKLNEQLKVLTTPILTIGDIIDVIKSVCDGTYNNYETEEWDLPSKADKIITPLMKLAKQKINKK